MEYVCLWDVCGHKTPDFNEMIRHINYHAYHTKLMAVGFNARATLKLLRCKKDSKNRNHLPPLKGDHCCMWTGCGQTFDSMQVITVTFLMMIYNFFNIIGGATRTYSRLKLKKLHHSSTHDTLVNTA